MYCSSPLPCSSSKKGYSCIIMSLLHTAMVMEAQFCVCPCVGLCVLKTIKLLGEKGRASRRSVCTRKRGESGGCVNSGPPTVNSKHQSQTYSFSRVNNAQPSIPLNMLYNAAVFLRQPNHQPVCWHVCSLNYPVLSLDDIREDDFIVLLS